MVRAGALSYVIAVSIFIALILSALITLAYYQRVEFIELDQRNRLIRNAHSGFNFLLAANELEPQKELDLYGEDRDSVIIKHQSWGVYEVGTVTAFKRNLKFSKVGLIGYNRGVSEDALYLSDLNRPLSLAGNTLIKGNCSIPKAGVKRAYIEGQNYNRKLLVDGKTKNSGRKLPTLNPQRVQIIKELKSLAQSLEEEQEELELESGQVLVNPFDTTIIALFLDNTEDYELNGNIIVYSDRKVTISSYSKLRDVIVIAPKILIESGFEGSLQAFATDELLIENDVKLEYPSAIALLSNPQNVEQSKIEIGENSLVSGDVYLLSEQRTSKRVLLKVNNDAIIHGQAYVQGFTELRGKIYGSLYTDKFYLKTPSSIYENHVLNGEINYAKRSDLYVASDMLDHGNQRKVIKWIY